jgi:hypothetical protein
MIAIATTKREIKKLNLIYFLLFMNVIRLHDLNEIRVGHDQVFSLYAPIPIFQKNKFPDPITDQIFGKNSDQILIIDPIKNNAKYLPKETEFFANDNFLLLLVKTSTI